VEHPLLQFIRNPQFQALLAYIRKHPKEVACRGALADWLEEQGESEYAGYIRYECGLWEVPEGYNYDVYSWAITDYSMNLFDYDKEHRYQWQIVHRNGLLTEIKRWNLDSWLTFGKLAYAIGCVRRVEVVGILVPYSFSPYGIQRTVTAGVIDGYMFSYILQKELHDKIIAELPTNTFTYQNVRLTDDWPGLLVKIGTDAQKTQTKLLRIISRAAISHAREQAIADGIACV